MTSTVGLKYSGHYKFDGRKTLNWDGFVTQFFKKFGSSTNGYFSKNQTFRLTKFTSTVQILNYIYVTFLANEMFTSESTTQFNSIRFNHSGNVNFD